MNTTTVMQGGQGHTSKDTACIYFFPSHPRFYTIPWSYWKFLNYYTSILSCYLFFKNDIRALEKGRTACTCWAGWFERFMSCNASLTWPPLAAPCSLPPTCAPWRGTEARTYAHTHTARALCVGFCLITHPIALLPVCNTASSLTKTLHALTKARWLVTSSREAESLWYWSFTRCTQQCPPLTVYPQVKVVPQASSIMEGAWQSHLWDAEGRCHFKATRSGIT